MKKHISLLSNLLLSATLLSSAPAVAEERVEMEVVEFGGYCHMKFPPMREHTLSWDKPELNADAEKSISFYGPCNYDPTGPAEVAAQRAILWHGFAGDGSSEGSGD